jgi:hypothetical protein
MDREKVAQKHWREMSTARYSGRAAYIQGASLDNNPFEAGSITHRKWETGFRVAAAKDCKAMRPTSGHLKEQGE